MKLHELHAIPGANKAVTRKGRGIGSGTWYRHDRRRPCACRH